MYKRFTFTKKSRTLYMKKTILLFLFLLIGITFTKAQSVADTLINHCYTIDGTYQIQVVNSRNQPLIPTNLNQIVISNRDKNEVKYVKLGTEVRLKILPLTEINKSNFTPLPKIGYVTE